VDGKELTTRVVSPSVACLLLGQSVKAIVSTVERETQRFQYYSVSGITDRLSSPTGVPPIGPSLGFAASEPGRTPSHHQEWPLSLTSSG